MKSVARHLSMFCLALLCAGAIQAGDLEDGNSAYQRKDYDEAAVWYRAAAVLGNATAQFNLGNLYFFGMGVAQNQKEALRWYQLAAAQGNARAQHASGQMYERGQGTEQDYKEAVRWYKLASAQGYAAAQLSLGESYYKGQGVPRDYKEAVYWLQLAAAQGSQGAKQLLPIAQKEASESATTTANSNQAQAVDKPSDAETERRKRQEIEELLAHERRAKTAELEAATKKQQELEARLRESAERERLANEARVQASQTAPIAQVQQPQNAARKERRLALVIGNSNYKGSPLDNPANDATDIASQLRSFGFQTTLLRDATLNQMRDATRKFADQLPSTDVALVYFAGHGIEMKGRNYMIPTNADVKFEYELSEQAYDAGIWLDMLETIKSSNADRVNIVILDACRNNGLIAARSLSKGLGKMDAPSGTFLAYSTSPGKIASDGARGERNSPFTKHLIRAMQQPNKPIEEVFKEVRRNVGRDTNGSQVPWESTSLTGFFTFKQSQ